MRKFNHISVITLLFVSLGCSQGPRFSPMNPSTVDFGNGNGGNGNNHVINTVKPALVTRASGCVMCHGHFSSNVITDFGYGGDGRGLNYFFGGIPGQTLPSGIYNRAGGSAYGDEDPTSNAPNWVTANFEPGSKVIVPYAPVAGQDVVESTLFQYLKNIIAQGPSATTATVEEVKSMFIGAPNAQRIMSVGGLSAGGIRFVPSISGAKLTGLALNASGYYASTVGTPIVCEGDVFIDGVVYLNQPTIQTQKGCRIYATKSVFISAPLQYAGGSTEANLEISSSRMVALGLGHNTCNIPQGLDSSDFRLTYTANDWYKGFFTRDLGTPSEMLGKLKADADLIGPTLPDANCTSQGRASGFDHLLLNAPMVQSRYQGRFNGVIISEITLLSLGTTDYIFDPVFLRVPILPQLNNSDFLTVEN